MLGTSARALVPSVKSLDIGHRSRSPLKARVLEWRHDDESGARPPDGVAIQGDSAGWRGRQQDSVPAPDVPLRPGEDCGLSAAFSPAVARGISGAPNSRASRDESAPPESEASVTRHALAAARKAAARPSVAGRREVSRADPRHAEAALSVNGHR